MSLSSLFKSLGAPFVNTSRWGAVRGDDGAVFLRVWQDEIKKIGDFPCCRVTANSRYAHSKDAGWLERLGHVSLVREGAKCFLVVAIAKDRNAVPRVVKDFLDGAVIEGTEITEFDGDTWIRLGRRIPVGELAVPAV